MFFLGIDTGGTFTDFVYLDGTNVRVHKVLSSPDAPERAILDGIRDLGLEALCSAGELVIVHGTTVATNATLEGKGVRTAYITNEGLADVLLIGRQNRDNLYDLDASRTGPKLDRSLCFEVSARVGADGEVITEPTSGEIDTLVESVMATNPAAVAINLLFSFLNDTHERKIEDRLPDTCFVARSSFVLPVYREYERGVATWVNAWIGPLINDYLLSLTDQLSPSKVAIMQSSGLTISAKQAARRAVNLLLSGPAGGLQAARQFCSGDRLMTFDMGGTSTDVSLIDGDLRLTNETVIAGLPIAIPMADIHTIGAGGGSIAFVDDGGLLRVGPASAGAVPGPACYGAGGSEPTVTDANLVVGHLQASAFLGGRMILDVQAAEAAIAPLATRLGLSVDACAAGILRVANEHMIQALRMISVERGFDPREFSLACFGGAGGLHFLDLAEALDMTQAVVPANGGVFSALGMLAAQPGRDITRTHRARLDEVRESDLELLFDHALLDGCAELEEEGITEPRSTRFVDLRYLGQTFTLTLPYTDLNKVEAEFHQAHEERYGHQLDMPVELVNLRVHLVGSRTNLTLPELPPAEASQPVPDVKSGLPVISRDKLAPGQQLQGPLLVVEAHATTLIKAGWGVNVQKDGNLLLTRHIS